MDRGYAVQDYQHTSSNQRCLFALALRCSLCQEFPRPMNKIFIYNCLPTMAPLSLTLYIRVLASVLLKFIATGSNEAVSTPVGPVFLLPVP